MKRTAPLILVLALAACNQQTGSATITTNSQTGKVTTETTGNAPTSAAALDIKPGKWETTITTLDLKTTGLPKGMPANMMPPKPGPVKVTACVTAEDAKKGPGEMLKDSKLDCTIKSNTFAGGVVSSDATCKLPNGTMSMKMTGTYTPTEITYDSEASVDAGPVHSVTTKHTVSRRIGDCK